jgi:hypothetical protein
VPHHAARLTHVHRFGQHERRDVTHLAVGVLAEVDILDDRVERIVRVELTKGPTGDLLVRYRLTRGRERQHIVDDDRRDARLRRRDESEHGRGGDAQRGAAARTGALSSRNHR